MSFPPGYANLSEWLGISTLGPDDLGPLRVVKCARCGKDKWRGPDDACMICMNDDIHEAQEIRRKRGEWMDEHD